MAHSGQILDGKYRIISELGRGGMSVVYLAVDLRLNKKWAVKEVRRFADGFMAEADIIKNFDHPVLPRIVDVISTDEAAFIVMDYIEGRPLNEVLTSEGPQSPEMVVRWAESLCDALIYLHSLDPPVIYRDMKPSNIMLKPDGSVRLIDFGASVRLGHGRTSDNISFGTMGYAAPEQMGSLEFLSVEYADARSDIFSLGATMYTLLNGEVPKHPGKMQVLIENSKTPIPDKLGKIIIKCMSYYPEDRFESCEELLIELHKYKKLNTDKRKKSLLLLAVILTVGCMLITVVSRYNGGGRHSSEAAVADTAKAELFMQMGIDFFEQFMDYKKSAGYFELAEKAGLNEAKIYKEISLALSELDVDYDRLAVMFSEFGEMTDTLPEPKRKLDNYKLMGEVYNEYCTYIKDSENMLIDVGDKGLATLEKCDEKDGDTNKAIEYYIAFCQYAAIGYEKTGDSSGSKEYYENALEYVERILDITYREDEIVIDNIGLREIRRTKLVKKAELLTKLSRFDEAGVVYENGEKEYGIDGGDFYIGHLSLLCEIEEEKTTDVEQWDYEKLIGLYEKGNEISGIKDDYRWKRLGIKLKPLMEKQDKGG